MVFYNKFNYSYLAWLHGFTYAFTKNNNYTSFNENKLIYLKIFIILLGFLLVVRATSVIAEIYLRYGSIFGGFSSGEEIYNLSRSGQWAPGIGFYFPVDYLSMFLAGIYHRLKNKLDLLTIVVLLSTIIIHVSLQSRFTLLMNFSLYFGAYVGANKTLININPRSLIKGIILTSFLIFIISYSRNLSESNSVSGNWGDFDNTFLPSIYYYLTNGIAGLNEYIKIGVDDNDWLYTFNPILNYLSVFDSSINVNIYESVTYYTPVPTIITTWLRFLIDDFGYIGSYLVLFLIGIILKFSEFKLKSSLSIFWLSIYAHFISLFVYSFFGYAFFIASFWLSLILSCFIGLVIDSSLAGIIFNTYIKGRK